MIKKYPLLSLVSLITLLFAAVDLSAQAGTHKATFAQKDIMGSAAFIQNNQLVGDFNGQKILYFTHHDNINAFFTANGLVYKVNKIDEKKLAKREKEEREKAHEKRKEGEDEGEEAIPVKATTFAMEWVGANPHAVIESAQKKDGYYSYIKKEGNSTKSVITDGFKTLTYKELYPGIDVVYSFPEKGGVKYNLVVHPGADISQVKMTWSGIRSLKKDVDGNLLVHAHNGDIMEHAPVSFATGHVVATEYEIKGNTVQFRLPQGYNKNEVLTIDPWVTALTTLPPSNVGFDVDYDFLGNLFVYGTGQVDIYDLSSFCQITKYNSAGVALWTFSGQITTPINWTSGDVNDNINYPSNMIVDKSNGKAYTGQGYFFGGATVVRLNPAGQYDNFISAVDPNFQEVWCFAYNCLNASVLALGGGTTSNVNMAIINTTSGSTTTTNISGISSSTGNFQDIVCGTYDTAGSLYVMMNDGLGILPYTNTIYKVNSAFNGNIWATNSNYSCFGELRNAPFWSANGGGINCNGNNCLSANGSYLFYYDGNNIAAHDLVSGNTVGTSYHINNYDSLMQGGIAVDNCNHVYVGGVGVIKTFTFNGSNFTPGADIPLGGAFSNDTLHDVKYNSTNNLLYVAGSGVVGTYVATLSTTCNPASTYTLTTSNTCNSATVTVTPSSGLNPLTFNYIWTDSVGNILSQSNNSNSLTNTLNGLTDGTYIIQVQWNSNCGGLALSDSVTIHCSTASLITSNDTTICPGQTVTLTATPSPTGGTFVWNPGGATTSSITVSPGATTTYTVTYTPPTGAPISANITVTVNSTPVSVSVNNASECAGDSATLTATPSVGGGTYSWSPGNYNTSSITVLPGANTTYTVTYTSGCGTATATGLVTLQPAPTVQLTENPTTCGNANGSIDITAGSGTAPYQYALNGGSYQLPDSFTSLASATYTITVKDANGCSASDTISVMPSIGITITLTPVNPTCGGSNGKIIVNASSGIQPYQYSLNGGTYQALDTFNSLPIGFYTIQAKDATGCIATDTISLIEGPPVTITVTADSVKCFGSTDGKVYASATGGIPPYQYSLNSGPYQTQDTFTVGIGNYTVSVQDQGGCTANGSVQVYEPTQMIIDSIITTAVKCIGDKNGTMTVYSSGGTPPYNYSTTKDGANFDFATNGLIVNLDTGLYTVILSDGNGCTITDTASIANAIPDYYAVTTDSTSCYGKEYHDGAIHVTPLTQSLPNSPFQYSLDSAAFQTSGDFTGIGAGLYDVVAMSKNGCKTDIPNVVVPEPAQAFASILPGDTTLKLGQSIQLSTDFWPYSISTIVSYNWTPTLGLSCNDCPNPVLTSYARENTYTETITYNDHCKADATIKVIVLDNPEIFIPNSFTPNGDGNNDIFLIYGENIKTLNLKIFNRWGELVFESNSQWNGWDGTYKGVLQNPAVFVYETNITLLDDKKIFRKGGLTLVR